MICERCGMYYVEWHQTWEDMNAGKEPMIPNIHECPEPFPRDVAVSLVQFHASSGAPMHPRDKARCVLALRDSESG
jgi:hypothetical protein